jgi:hypothetical protein
MNHSAIAARAPGGLRCTLLRLAPLPPLLGTVQRWLRRTAVDDEVPAALQARREAAAVRAMADTYRATDPGFASDLYAAASRHEMTAEAHG